MGKRRTFINHLAEEIIEEILYNLPVKSLLRFRSVSKSWHSLNSSKSFIKHHLNKSKTDIDFTRREIMLSFCQSPNSVGFMSLFDNNSNNFRSCPIRSLLEYDPIITHHTDSSDYNVDILGSCNGLKLMRINGIYLFLWNPSTKMIRKIPQPASFSREEQSKWEDIFIYGLGYDECTDDYKVTCIHSMYECQKPFDQTEIYSSKSNSWKKIECFDKGFVVPDDTGGKFVNGKLHWLAVQYGGDNDIDIVSLDLVKEKFDIVDRPENFSTSTARQTVLRDLGGYLSLVSYVPKVDTKVWVMKEYGVKESWTKIWTLSDFADPKTLVKDAMPLFLKSNGDIAVAFGLDVVVCNGKTKLHESRSPIVDETVGTAIVDVASLVSPFDDELYRR